MAKNTTLKFLDIKEIGDNVVLLKQGSLRSVLMVSAINFNLKTEEEQRAIIEGFKNFLNALDFPIQILVQSRALDPGPYIKQLEAARDRQTNELLRAHTSEYIEFVNSLIKAARIMSKNFYIIIPLEPGGVARQKGKWLGVGRGERLKELAQRTQQVSSGLAGVGLPNVQLKTQELLELFYTSYNADISHRQKLFDVSVVETPVVRSTLEAKENKTIK